MNRNYEEKPKGKHFKAAVILLREITHCGVLTPQRAAELIQSENKDLEGLLWMRTDGEWALSLQLRKALRTMTGHRMAWDRSASRWLIPDVHRKKVTGSSDVP